MWKVFAGCRKPLIVYKRGRGFCHTHSYVNTYIEVYVCIFATYAEALSGSRGTLMPHGAI